MYNLKRSMRRRAVGCAWLLCLILVVASASRCTSDSITGGENPPASLTGEILGLVTGDGTPVSGVTITLTRSGTEVTTVMTTGNGEFGFTDLDAGTYTVAISEIAGMNCSRQLAATVVAGEETEMSFACVTPASPAPVGTVEGRVTVNGVGAGRALVSVRDASRHIGSTTTANDGTYQFTNVPTGVKSVWIVTEEPCPGTQQDNTRRDRRELEVTVSEEGVAAADFACTGQVITGSVTVNGISVSGLSVLVCYSPSVWDDGCVSPSQATDSEGRYAYTSLLSGLASFPPGDYFVFVQSPSGTTCPERLGVPVPSGVAVTVDFACVQDIDSGSGSPWAY